MGNLLAKDAVLFLVLLIGLLNASLLYSPTEPIIPPVLGRTFI